MIFPHEVRLTSRRYPMDGQMGLDDTGKRIERLMQHYLVRLGVGVKEGVLFRDPMDGRFWELRQVPARRTASALTLPELVCIPFAEAAGKYGPRLAG